MNCFGSCVSFQSHVGCLLFTFTTRFSNSSKKWIVCNKNQTQTILDLERNTMRLNTFDFKQFNIFCLLIESSRFCSLSLSPKCIQRQNYPDSKDRHRRMKKKKFQSIFFKFYLLVSTKAEFSCKKREKIDNFCRSNLPKNEFA